MSEPQLSLADLLGGASHNNRKQQRTVTPLAADAMAMQLREMFASYNEQHRFVAGDLVTFKPGMCIYGHMAVNAPMIITAILEKPLEKDHRGGTPYIYENDVIECGHIDNDGDFVKYAYDPRRLQPFVASSCAETSH